MRHDIAAQVNRCRVNLLERDGTARFVTMRSEPGSPAPVCAAGPRERLVARSPEALVVFRPGGDFSASFYRSCLLPRSRKQTFIQADDFGSGGGSRVELLSLAGHQAAWSLQVYERDGTDYDPSPSLDRADLLTSRSSSIRAAPDGRTAFITALAVAGEGSAVWVGDGSGFGEIAVARPGRTRVVLDRGMAGELTAPAISPDGRSASWLRGGIPVSAVIPTAADDAPLAR